MQANTAQSPTPRSVSQFWKIPWVPDKQSKMVSRKIRFREDIREKRDSAQCDNAQSRTPRSITLRQVCLRAVSHCTESGN